MTEDRIALTRIERALRMVSVPFPQLGGLAAAARVTLDPRVPTMGVFASGRLVANPAFVGRLNESDLVFVLAHEMLHLALRTHDRARGAGRLEFNFAHDYIINDMLRVELGATSIPANGLDMPGARERSAEEIVLEMRRNRAASDAPRRVWEQGEASGSRGGAEQNPDDDGGDVLADDLERRWYPDDASKQRAQAEKMKALAARSLALAEAIRAMRRNGRGTGEGADKQTVAALRGIYRTPWQFALQRWMESVAPGERTFTRASRRTAAQPDVVLPGRRREGWMLNVVLDTSASMSDEIARALGAIGHFCDAAAVDQVRLVQCDAAVTSDELVAPEALSQCEVQGYGGSDLSPALEHLAADGRARAVVVITDGDITYPPTPMPYDLLWVVPANAPVGFMPPYGRVVSMH